MNKIKVEMNIQETLVHRGRVKLDREHFEEWLNCRDAGSERLTAEDATGEDFARYVYGGSGIAMPEVEVTRDEGYGDTEWSDPEITEHHYAEPPC